MFYYLIYDLRISKFFFYSIGLDLFENSKNYNKIFRNHIFSQELLWILFFFFSWDPKQKNKRIGIRIKLSRSKKERRFMAKGKDVRIRVILECISCVRKGTNKESTGISRYSTQKNRHNTPGQLELRKFCRYCRKHTTHNEIKKQEHRVFDFSKEQKE